MKEHDIVETIVDIPNVPKNTRGTIVLVYNETTFEVEFVINGINYVETLTKNNLKKV